MSEAESDVRGRRQIAIVGAGARFTPGLLLGLVAQPGLAGAAVRVFDLDPQRLAIVERWGRRLAAEHGAPFTVRATPSLREALAGADAVVSTVRAGGSAAMRGDLQIPARHGIEQGVADTVGPGGVLFALRQIPALLEIARTMEAVCPAAWLLTFSNPMTAMCRAVMRTSPIRCVGLCDGILGRRKWLAGYLGVPPAALDLRHAGINHLTWITGLQQAGEDGAPALAARRLASGDGDQPISFHLMDVYGLFPSPGDRHVAEFYPFFHRAGADGGRRYGLQTSVERLDTVRSWSADYWARFTAQADGEQPLPEPHPGAGEGAMALVAGLAGVAEPAFSGAGEDPLAGVFAANLPNGGGFVGELPSWAVVEGFVRADGTGLHPLPSGSLPAGIAATLRSRLEGIELTVEAALTGDRRVVVQALAADPLVPSLEQAEAIAAEALAEQAPYLPQFD